MADVHGVVAIRKKTFAAYLAEQLRGQAQGCCFRLSARVVPDGLKIYFKASATGGQNPTIEVPESGPAMFKFKYEATPAIDKYGLGGNLGTLELRSNYDLAVEVNASKLTIKQTLVVRMSITSLSTTRSGNLIDRTITDEYVLTATDTGSLQFSDPHTTQDNSPDELSISGAWGDFVNFFNNINDLIRQYEEWGKQLTKTGLKSVRLDQMRSFVFPGGQSFSFKSPAFSKNGDLTAAITYVRES
jgi:hypothetical protein